MEETLVNTCVSLRKKHCLSDDVWQYDDCDLSVQWV